MPVLFLLQAFIFLFAKPFCGSFCICFIEHLCCVYFYTIFHFYFFCTLHLCAMFLFYSFCLHCISSAFYVLYHRWRHVHACLPVSFEYHDTLYACNLHLLLLQAVQTTCVHASHISPYLPSFASSSPSHSSPPPG